MEDSFSKIINEKDAVRRGYKTDALFMDAVNAKMQDDKEDAFRIFSQLASISPDNATIHYELSRLWLDRNNVDYSIKESKKAVQLDSNNKWIQMQYADLLAYSGSFSEAASIYKKIALKERSPEEYLIRQAALLQKAKEYDEALKVYDQLVIYLGEDDETLLLQREQLFLSKNDIEGAANEVRKLIKFYPNDPQYAILLAAVYENNNLKDKAAVAYEEMSRRFPDDAEVQTAILKYCLRNKDLKSVMAHLEVIVLNQKLSAQERTDMLLPFVQNRNLDTNIRKETMELIHKFAYQEPPQKEPVFLLANVMVADGNLDEALIEYKRILAMDSSYYAPWQQVMYIYSIKSQQDSVIHYSNRAVNIFPKEYMSYYLGGLAYNQKGENRPSIQYLNMALKNVPERNAAAQVDVLIALGDVYNTVSNFHSSDSCYEAALIIQPNNATALNNFGYYLSVRGEKLDKAEKMSAKSLRLRPNEANFLDTYGWILYRQGKFREAKDYVLKAISMTSPAEDDTSLWDHLGDIEYKSGDKQKALEYWNKAASKGMKSAVLEQKIREQKLHD
ncbi:tetratricopeptide repeat protein [Taibaiella lutea]|nr:tetratricopeptide repeat protein [Taibaiella lutea]